MTATEKALELLGTGETVSGGRMARELWISRNAVWKVMNRLRQEGYGIEAATKRGYRLLSATDSISRMEIERWLKTKTFAREMEIHETLDSTNNRAKTLAAQGAAHGLLVAADSQSGGRGRRGRNFFSPGASGIYVSFILRPKVSPEQASLLTSLAAVAAARAIETLAPADVKIKWVNDLYLGGKKICGILSEAGMDMETGGLDYAVVGIGVNVLPMEFPPELSGIATSIGNETGKTVSRNRLIAEIANQLENLYGDLETGNFLEESRRRSNVIGRKVQVFEGGRSYPAEALGIDEKGKLIIRSPEGETHLGFGEVSLKLE